MAVAAGLPPCRQGRRQPVHLVSRLDGVSVRAVNRPGLTHIAFLVEDVAAAQDAVIAAGDGAVGEIVSLGVSDSGTVTFLYATDPEGNIIELQSWA